MRGPGLVYRGWSHSREKRVRVIAKGFGQEAEDSYGVATRGGSCNRFNRGRGRDRGTQRFGQS